MYIRTLVSSRLSRSAAGASAVVILVLAGCGSVPASSGTSPSLASGASSGSPAASAPAVSPEATPDVTSTTLPGASSPPAGSINFVFAGPPPHFEPKTLSAPAGDLSFALSNTSLAFHDLAIGPTRYHSLATSGRVAVGATAVFSVRGLPAGSYVIWCTVADHAALGMVGTLTVH